MAEFTRVACPQLKQPAAEQRTSDKAASVGGLFLGLQVTSACVKGFGCRPHDWRRGIFGRPACVSARGLDHDRQGVASFQLNEINGLKGSP